MRTTINQARLNSLLMAELHPEVLVNIEDSKIASEFISFRKERRFFYEAFKWFSIVFVQYLN